jgi:LysM repeat protein
LPSVKSSGSLRDRHTAKRSHLNMSLVNDALKRAQQAQAGNSPTEDAGRQLQPAVATEDHRKATPIWIALAAIGSLSLVIGFAISSQQGLNESRAIRLSKPVAPSRFVPGSTTGSTTEFKSESPVTAVTETLSPPAAPVRVGVIQETTPAPIVQQVSPTAVSAPVSSRPGARRVIDSQTPALSGELSKVKVYVVRPGDTLTRIANRHGTTVKALRVANGLKADRIVIGQRLWVPVAPSESSGAG